MNRRPVTELCPCPRETMGARMRRQCGPVALAVTLIAGIFMTGCREDKADAQAAIQPLVPKIEYDTLSSRIKMGESFNTIIRELGLPDSEVPLLLLGIKDNFRFKLYAGQSYKVIFTMTPGGRSFHEFILEDRFYDRKHVLARPASLSSPSPAAEFAAASVGSGSVGSGSVNPALPSEPAHITQQASGKLTYAVIDIPIRIDHLRSGLHRRADDLCIAVFNGRQL